MVMVENPQIGEIPVVREQIQPIMPASSRGRFNNTLRYAALAFTAGALALSVACSPAGAAEGQRSQPERDVLIVDIRPGPRLAQAQEEATLVPTVVIPTEEPKPPQPEKKPLPQEAEQFLVEIADLPSISSRPGHAEAIREGFENDWNAADTELKKYSAYIIIISSLRSGYDPAKDHDRTAEMKKIQEFLANQPQWSRYHQANMEAGTF